jgi:hypothetical protein
VTSTEIIIAPIGKIAQGKSGLVTTLIMAKKSMTANSGVVSRRNRLSLEDVFMSLGL